MNITEQQLLQASYQVLLRELDRGAPRLLTQPSGRLRKLVDRKRDNSDLVRLAEFQITLERGVKPPIDVVALFEHLQPETTSPGDGFFADWWYIDTQAQWHTAVMILRQMEQQQYVITPEGITAFLESTPYLRDLPKEITSEVAKDILTLKSEGVPKAGEIRKILHSTLLQLGCKVRKGDYADVVNIPGDRWVMGLQFGLLGDPEQVKFYFRLKQGESRFEIRMIPLNLGIRQGVPREFAWNQLRKNRLALTCAQVAGIIDFVNETVDEAGLTK